LNFQVLKLMRLTNKLTYLFAGFLSASFLFIAPADAASFDHSIWNQFLKKYVNAAGEVNYKEVQAQPQLLNQYVEALRAAGAGQGPVDWPLNAWPREERLAFWLNAYHAGVVLKVIENYPLKSLNDVSGAWSLPILKVGAASFSLNDIRAQQLIASFRDEKIHLALACSAKSCPPFPAEAFTGPRVEGQLFMITNQRVQDTRFVGVDINKKRVFLSRLFYWYGDDFILDFGALQGASVKFTPPDMAVLSFIRHYIHDAEAIDFLDGLQFKIKYLPFDWTLADWNGQE